MLAQRTKAPRFCPILHAHLLKKEEEGGLPSWARVAADKAYDNGVAGIRVLTPGAGRLTQRKDSFNYYLSSLRILVEQVFGIVVGLECFGRQ
jgi:hypothetical protein